MDKANIFRSSNFHMDSGDVLSIIIDDEVGDTVSFDLVDSDIPKAPLAPTTRQATSVTSSGFTANWYMNQNSTEYYLDVSTDPLFATFLAGYNNKSKGDAISDAVAGLTGNVPYYYRVRAKNQFGTSVSSTAMIVVTSAEVVVDGDGNNYTYVTIGTQQWLVENLKTTKYIDGTAIPNLTVDADWIVEDGTGGHDGAYCWYSNNIANKTPYGGLYNWYAVDNTHGLAPTGWRVATSTDFATLTAFLGGNSVAGGKLKETGIIHWNNPNIGAVNEVGFSLVGTGSRLNDGTFVQINEYGNLICSNENSPTEAIVMNVKDSNIDIRWGYHSTKNYGYTVRCMRDL